MYVRSRETQNVGMNSKKTMLHFDPGSESYYEDDTIPEQLTSIQKNEADL